MICDTERPPSPVNALLRLLLEVREGGRDMEVERGTWRVEGRRDREERERYEEVKVRMFT